MVLDPLQNEPYSDYVNANYMDVSLLLLPFKTVFSLLVLFINIKNKTFSVFGESVDGVGGIFTKILGT